MTSWTGPAARSRRAGPCRAVMSVLRCCFRVALECCSRGWYNMQAQALAALQRKDEYRETVLGAFQQLVV